MRTTQITRHLGEAAQPATTLRAAAFLKSTVDVNQQEYPGNIEFSPRDYIAYLLSVDAEIEHCLMVQYLYAAYSLGGPQVPAEYRAVVRNWKDIILGIAKEEMGHLISIQNSLRLIGAPLHMEREDYPWDVPFYPFPFALEPLTLDSLAKYVYAEAPQDWDGGALGKEIRARVYKQAGATPVHHVAELFNTLIPLVQNPDYVPDDIFNPNTYAVQANWAEWGRGYHGGQRGNSQGAPAQTPDVLVEQQSNRDDMVTALQAIASQGENTEGATDSHFVRFLKIYVEMRELIEGKHLDHDEWKQTRPEIVPPEKWAQLKPESQLVKAVKKSKWSPARAVATNPYVSLSDAQEPELGGTKTTRITNKEAILWAQLHNIRYRMLLTYLIHSFTLHGGLTNDGERSPRGVIINATFGEMYSLRAISDILMQLPVSADEKEKVYAGPPFQMPYTLSSPFGETNRWRGHLDLLTAADKIIQALLSAGMPTTHHSYLYSLRESDNNLRLIIQRILSANIDTALL